MLNERARKKRKKEEAAAQTREDIPKTSPDASCPPCGLPRTANKGGQEGRFKGGGTTQKREHPEYDPNNNLAMLLTQAFNQTLGGPAGRHARTVQKKVIECIQEIQPKLARRHVTRASTAHGPHLAAHLPC